jgi:signal transduction histidine kinase
VCLLAAGAAIITAACGLVARHYLMGQADQQLRAYADRLTSRPFMASPVYGSASGAPGGGGPSGGVLGIEVRGSGGQLVMRAAKRPGPGPAIPAVPAGAAAPAGRPGLSGTLVVGLTMGGIGHAIGRLAVTGLAVSGAMALVVACIGVMVTRAMLRPVTHIEKTLDAVASGELSRRVPEPHGGGDAVRLARSLNMLLSRIEHASRALAESEAAARRSTGRLCRIVDDTGHQLSRPISVIHGFAEAFRPGRRRHASELDRMMRRVASEAARMDAAIDDLAPARHDHPRPPQR